MSAPALEKGLDILEKLLGEVAGLTLSQLASKCDRSVSEIQRMVQVLHQRGYIDKSDANVYRLGLKSYALGRFRHPFQHLQETAEPVMSEIAEQLGHSVHLSVEDRGQMRILTEILGPGLASISLKVGTLLPLEKTLSGRILLTGRASDQASEDSDLLKSKGYLAMPSWLYTGVLDIGVPVRTASDNTILGVLTCSLLEMKDHAEDLDPLVQILRKGAARISLLLNT